MRVLTKSWLKVKIANGRIAAVGGWLKIICLTRLNRLVMLTRFSSIIGPIIYCCIGRMGATLLYHLLICRLNGLESSFPIPG